MERLSKRWLYYCGLLAGVCPNINVDDLKHIQNLIDAEDQGLLLKLPCKVGDVLYLVYDCGRNPEMIEAKVESFELEKCHSITRIKIYFEGRTGFETCLLDGTLNDGVFLTKAEAEKALAEMEK